MLKTINPPQIAYPVDGSVHPVERFSWAPVQIEPPRPREERPEKLQGKQIALVGGQILTATRIARALRQEGAAVFYFTPSLNQNKELAAALAEFKTTVGHLDGIIDLTLEEPFTLERSKLWERNFGQTIGLLQTFYQEWAAQTNAQSLFYVAVTRLDGQMGYSLDENYRVVQPLGGIWAGLAKSLPREIPNCNVKIIDLAEDDYPWLDRILVEELYDWGLFEVGYRRGQRYGIFARQEPVGPTTLWLDRQDTVLISGGARGIGFALARELARNFGCRVAVTGRSALPDQTPDWLVMDEAAFKQYEYARLKAVPAGQTPVSIKRELAQQKSLRELYTHMQQVAQERLPIEYYLCDFTDVVQVEQLLEQIGPGLSGIIHNAGIDQAGRLNTRSIEECLATVRIKVNGFLNLYRALQNMEEPPRLKFWCNVGSLSGRMGGMVGQLDYGAANDGLARLGFWAAQENSYPVKTLCWPTWEKLGLISNYEAALKYMSALHVEEGLYRWQRELLAGTSQEVMFIGQTGPALAPAQLAGYLKTSHIPGIERLNSQAFYLGEVREFELFRRVSSTNRLDLRLAPGLQDFQLGRRPALPVSLALEYALSVGDWVVPEGWPKLYLHQIKEIEMNLAALQSREGEFYFEFGKVGRGYWEGDSWIVEVKMYRPDLDDLEMARLKLVYSRQPASSSEAKLAEWQEQDNGNCVDIATQLDNPSTKLWPSWAGYVFELAGWQKSPAGVLSAQIGPVSSADLWLVAAPPSLRLPVAPLENILRYELATQKPSQDYTRLKIARLNFYSIHPNWPVIRGQPATRRWYVGDHSGQIGLELENLQFC